jgi:hypothetical protein
MENVKNYPTLVAETAPMDDLRLALDKYPKVIISRSAYEHIALFAHLKARAKEKEAKAARAVGEKNQYQNDYRKMHQRSITGALAEYGVQEYMKSISNTVEDFFDDNIGHSKDFNVPDIPQFGIGIKACSIGNVPVVPLYGHNQYSQIIAIVDEEIVDEKDQLPVVYICGIADPVTLNSNTSIDLVRDPKLKARKTKGGFNGFDVLDPVTSIL